jgi:hypothetical protein
VGGVLGEAGGTDWAEANGATAQATSDTSAVQHASRFLDTPRAKEMPLKLMFPPDGRLFKRGYAAALRLEAT